MHRRQVVVTVFAPFGGIAHVFVIESPTVVATARIFCTHHQFVEHLAETACPVALETQRPVHRFGVLIAAHMPIARRTQNDGGIGIRIIVGSHKVTFIQRMDIGQRRGTAGMLIVLRRMVGRRERATQRQIGNPRLVEQPVQLHIGTQRVVLRLGIVVQLLVRVFLRVQSSDITCEAHIQRQRHALAEEDIHVVQRQVVTLIGIMGRGHIAEGTGMLQRRIQHTPLMT